MALLKQRFATVLPGEEYTERQPSILTRSWT